MKCLNSRTTYLKPKLIAVQKKRIKIIHCNLQIKYTLRKILQFQRSIDPLDNPLRRGGLFFFRVVNHANVQEHLFLDGKKPVGYMISFAQSMGFKAWLW